MERWCDLRRKYWTWGDLGVLSTFLGWMEELGKVERIDVDGNYDRSEFLSVGT